MEKFAFQTNLLNVIKTETVVCVCVFSFVLCCRPFLTPFVSISFYFHSQPLCAQNFVCGVIFQNTYSLQLCACMHYAYEILCSRCLKLIFGFYTAAVAAQAPERSYLPLFAISCFIIKIQLTFYSSCSSVCARQYVWYIECVHTFCQTTLHSPLASFASTSIHHPLYIRMYALIRCALCA